MWALQTPGESLAVWAQRVPSWFTQPGSIIHQLPSHKGIRHVKFRSVQQIFNTWLLPVDLQCSPRSSGVAPLWAQTVTEQGREPQAQWVSSFLDSTLANSPTCWNLLPQHQLSWCFSGHSQMCVEQGKHLSPSTGTSPGEGNQVMFQLSYRKQVSFSWSVYYATFPPFLCFLLVILLFRVAPQHSAEELSRFPKCKKPVVCLREKYGAGQASLRRELQGCRLCSQC